LIQRENAEKAFQFTQEIRFASAKSASDVLSWQGGAFFFAQDYEQTSFNFFPNPVFLRYPVGTPAFRSFTEATLEDRGVGVFGQATFRVQENLHLSLGLRADFEEKEADLRTFTVPAGFGAVTSQNLGDDYTEASPTFTASYRIAPDQLAYASIAHGYKAGGFNAASPAGTERFDPESSWNYEAGWKASWLDQRLRTNLAAFYTRWSDLQLNVPALVPGQFYVANVASAASKGVEFELTARPAAGWDIFAGAGWIAAKFRSGSRSEGMSVSGNRVPLTPKYTVSGGTQYSFAINRDLTAFVRGEVTAYGKFYYDDHNTRSQGLYSLTNLRVGLRGRQWSVEGWVRNAFDEDYVPLAIPYPGLAPSGFVGESGAPVTTGVSVGWRF
jgi:iron complex outermembrane receptor protein